MKTPTAFNLGLRGLLLLLSTLGCLAQPQEAWVARYNGGFTNKNHTPLAVKLDAVGNIYVAGTSQNASNLNDYVVVKYAPSGQLLWSTRHSATNAVDYTLKGFALGSDGSVRLTGTGGTVAYGADGQLAWTSPYAGRDVALDTNGNAYVTGFSAVDFATVKLSPGGSNIWESFYDSGTNFTNVAQKVAVDALGRVYVAGWAVWNRWTAPMCSGFCYDSRPVAVCYDSAGSTLWLNPYTTYGLAWGETVAVLPDDQGNVYITGNDDSAYQTAKINASGQAAWTWVYGGPGVSAMALASNGGVYLTGGVTEFPNNVFGTFKLANSGNVVWEATYRGDSTGYTTENRALGIALDKANNVYVAGVSTNANTGNDIVNIKYDPDGHQLWVKRYNGPASGNDGATGIAVAPDGSIYVTGYSANESGGSDIVTIKYAMPTTIQKQPDGSMQLQGFGIPSQSYTFQAATNLLNWDDIGSSLADTNGIFQFTDTNAPSFPYRFYRWLGP